jgi:hypothetical protein
VNQVKSRRFLTFRSYSAFTVFALSVAWLLFLGTFNRALFDQMTDVISGHLWKAMIAVCTLLGFIVKGVWKNPPRGVFDLFENPLVQISIVIFASALGIISIHSKGLADRALNASKPGKINLLLSSHRASPQIRVVMTYSINDGNGRDTVIATSSIMAPVLLESRSAGNYRFKIAEEGYSAFEASKWLKPGDSLDIELPDEKVVDTLVVASIPSGVEVMAGGRLLGKAPGRLLLSGSRLPDKVVFQLAGYVSTERHVLFANHLAVVGLVRLVKPISVRFVCESSQTSYGIRSILSRDGEIKCAGSQSVSLAAGAYSISYVTADGRRGSKNITVPVPENLKVPIP